MSLQRLSGIASSSGVIRNQATGAGIPGATIELLTSTGETTGTYYQSDGNGAFVAPTFGAYGLRFTSAEFSPLDMAAQTVGQNMEVFLMPKYTELEGITITAGGKKNTWLWLALAAFGYYAYKKKLF